MFHSLRSEVEIKNMIIDSRVFCFPNSDRKENKALRRNRVELNLQPYAQQTNAKDHSATIAIWNWWINLLPRQIDFDWNNECKEEESLFAYPYYIRSIFSVY